MTSKASLPMEGEQPRSRGAKEAHGLCRHPLYRTWLNLLDRVLNPNNPYFHNYGGRGIKVDPQVMSFPGFLAIVGDRPSPQHQLDRKDNNGNYEPGNLRWATKKEQARNQRKNRLLTVNGETKPLAEWAEEQNLAPSTIFYRLAQGMSETEAVLTPARINGRT